MRNFIQAALTLTILVRALPSMADQSYVVQSISPEGSNLLFEIGYTAGVHKGSASQVEGLVNFDANNQLTLANFTVPLSSLSTGNSTRDCHMREALGINYELSNFPKDHVCEAGDVLPSSGPNSVAYPTIEFEFSKLASSSLPLPSVLVPGQVYTIEVQGRWKIHGVARDQTQTPSGESLTLQIQRLNEAGNKLRVQGKFDVILADFGIIVKPFKIIGPIAINVADRVKVKLNLRLDAQ